MIEFLCQIEILLLIIFKLLKISRFFHVFFLISQIPGFSRLFLPKIVKFQVFQGFSRFPGKVATLYIHFIAA